MEYLSCVLGWQLRWPALRNDQLTQYQICSVRKKHVWQISTTHSIALDDLIFQFYPNELALPLQLEYILAGRSD